MVRPGSDVVAVASRVHRVRRERDGCLCFVDGSVDGSSCEACGGSVACGIGSGCAAAVAAADQAADEAADEETEEGKTRERTRSCAS